MAELFQIKLELESESPSANPAMKSERASPALQVDAHPSDKVEPSIALYPPSDNTIMAGNEGPRAMLPSAFDPLSDDRPPTIRKSSAGLPVLEDVQSPILRASQRQVDGSTYGNTLGANRLPKTGGISQPSKNKKAVRRSTSVHTANPDGPLCDMCPGHSEVSCETCGSVRYCSKECKAQDEHSHRLFCSKWANSQERPGPAFRRAIYFPENPENGQISFVWLEFWHSKNEDNEDSQVPLLANFFAGFPGQDRKKDIVTQNDVLCRPLDRSFNVVSVFDQSFLSSKNLSITGLVDTKYSHPWKGPVLVFGATVDTGQALAVNDILLSDCRHILDFLTTYRSKALANDVRYFGQTVREVRIHCDGDRGHRTEDEIFDNTPLFEDVRVPLSHKLFHTAFRLPIPNIMEISILSASYPRNVQFGDWFQQKNYGAIPTTRCQGDYNQQYGDLCQEWLLESEVHKLPDPIDLYDQPEAKRYYSGSVFLARKDRKPLTALHVEALWKYNKRFLEEEMTKASNIHGKRDQSKVNQAMTREAFEVFYRHIRTGFAEDDRKKPSPYALKRRYGNIKEFPSSPFRKRTKYRWSSDGDVSDNNERSN